MRGAPGLIRPPGLIAPPGLQGLAGPGRRRQGGVRVDYLVVGGGGGGGGDWFGPSGGGGGGGVIFAQDQGLAPGRYRIAVGAGGRGGNAAQFGRGEVGGQSSIGDIIVALGGGGGGSYQAPPGGEVASGGGGYANAWSRNEVQVGGPATNGNKGGDARLAAGGGSSGGGGGATQPGQDGQGTVSGNGGIGRQCSITGELIIYGSGGGGGNNPSTGGTGAGRGGDGAGDGTIHGHGRDAAVGRGGGGGGGGYGAMGGSGGDGVVVIRVSSPEVSWTGAEAIEGPGYRTLVFRSSGWVEIV
jgi:hypothetical protein